MFQTFRNAWKIPELKNRLLFTLAILVVYRLGCAIPVPFVTSSALTQMFSNGNMLTYLDMMSGGALSRCTLFALGVTPYINASIIVQLLTVAIPSLENLAKEADGQQKLQQINRYAGGVIALIMSIGYYFVIRNMGALKHYNGAEGIFSAVVIIATFVAGAQLITWCGEQIDDKGIGNGVSLIIFASIVSNWSSLYTSVTGLLTQAASGKPQYYVFLPLLIVLALVAVVFVVIMTNGHEHDFQAEVQVLRGETAYVGVIGSRKKTAFVNQRLREAGIPEEKIAFVHTPVGTPIKAVTPEEIAVSIAGEMICVRAARREAAGEVHHGCPMH